MSNAHRLNQIIDVIISFVKSFKFSTIIVCIRDKFVTNTFYFCTKLVIECYHFFFNLPFILASMLAGVQYEPVSASQLEHFMLEFEKLLQCLEFIVDQILNLLEFHLARLLLQLQLYAWSWEDGKH